MNKEGGKYRILLPCGLQNNFNCFEKICDTESNTITIAFTAF
jgi:hypothetical protein